MGGDCCTEVLKQGFKLEQKLISSIIQDSKQLVVAAFIKKWGHSVWIQGFCEPTKLGDIYVVKKSDLVYSSQPPQQLSASDFCSVLENLCSAITNCEGNVRRQLALQERFNDTACHATERDRIAAELQGIATDIISGHCTANTVTVNLDYFTRFILNGQPILTQGVYNTAIDLPRMPPGHARGFSPAVLDSKERQSLRYKSGVMQTLQDWISYLKTPSTR